MLVRQKTYEENNAKLYMVGVPIGNYDDMSYRAVETLKNVDIIFCEDTRVTLKLLTYFNISKPLKSYHTFNENEITDILINYIEEGKNVAVVSDAGMPIISDPGYVAVFEAIKRSIDVVVIPGPSAFVSALVGSGISSRKIYFVGFLNSNDNKRKKELEKLKDLEETLIMYESPHRIRETLEMISELMPTRNICLARELTKKYEEYLHGTASEILEVIDEIKGEIVLIDFNSKNTSKILSTITSLIELNLRAIEEGKIDMLELPLNSLDAYDMDLLDKGIITYIPFGMVTGSSLLYNLGPKIPVKLSLVGDVVTGFSTDVTEYGINNALIKLMIDVKVDTRVILPIISEEINIDASIPIAMKVVQGKIPDYYMNGFSSKSNISN
mgnify:CR=1 FL=1